MAVDTSIPMFHAAAGFYVQRLADGSVRVMGTNGELPLATGANLRFDATLTQDTWASAVAHTSQRGDSAVVHDQILVALREVFPKEPRRKG